MSKLTAAPARPVTKSQHTYLLAQIRDVEIAAHRRLNGRDEPPEVKAAEKAIVAWETRVSNKYAASRQGIECDANAVRRSLLFSPATEALAAVEAFQKKYQRSTS